MRHTQIPYLRRTCAAFALIRLASLVRFMAAWSLIIPFTLAAADTPTVFVSVEPQAGLVDRIAGDRVQPEVFVRSGQDPHTFEATPKQVMALGRASLYLTIGMPFEKRLIEKVEGSSASLRIVDTATGISWREPAASDGHVHDDHAHHDESCADGRDPHVWLGPAQLRIIAKNTETALAEAYPSHTEAFRKGYEQFIAELDALDVRIRERLAPCNGKVVFVFHPAFGYFTDAYALQQKAVEVEGKIPTPKQLRALIAEARDTGAKVIFTQPQFDSRSAEAIAAAIGGTVVPMDPLARDILANLDHMASAVRDALTP